MPVSADAGQNRRNEGTTTPSGRPARDQQFARRLEQAADNYFDCPPKFAGRLYWVRDKLHFLGEDVSAESVRKWFAGESVPRQDKIHMLARIFEVDAAWLQMGHDSGMDVRERRVRNAVADGAVNLVAGIIQMDGGYPAFPAEDDVQAQRNHVDLHAIIRGAKYDIHVTVGEPHEREVTFQVPGRYDGVIVIGVVRDGFNFDFFELTPEVIVEHGVKRSGGLEVTISGDKLTQIESFAKRL